MYRRLRQPTTGNFIICCRTEQTPNPASRVRLSHDRNRLGVPKVRLDWRLSKQDIESARIGQKILMAEIRRLRIGPVQDWLDDQNDMWANTVAGGPHHMGTTRMHRDPKQGVVDENCRVHSMRNLYVAGSSVFPTGGWANPTLTLVALALRLSDHVKGLLC